MNWTGKIVARFYRVQGLRPEPIYLIECDDGERIWRYEDELDWAPGVVKGEELAEKRA